MLGLLMEERRGVAIAGTHGKTTTTAMVSFILLRAGLHPSFVIGGNVPQLGGPAGLGGGFGAGEILVAEACEYDRSFWNLHPEVAIITNVDRDHLDYFHDDADLVNAFRGLAGRVRAGGVLVVSADDARAQEAVRPVSVRKVTFGSAPEADWCFRPWQRRRQDGRTRFRPTCGGRDLGEFELRVAGEHNVRNALAAAAACAELGVPVEVIRRALAEYRGAGRRLEPIGSARGVDVMDDYAHHPTEIVATLCGFREDHPTRRLWCVFQPHQYSRTRLLMDGFARAFDLADRVVVPDIFTARDSGADRNAVSSVVLVERLRANGVAAEHVPTYDEVVEYLEEKVSAGDVVLTMGAGPVNGVGRSLLGRLVENQVEVGSYANSV
jgi:UDP-N-acetylmuramate--alanine ligase